MRSDPVVFLGPSLSRPEAAAILSADYRPPITRGDLAPLLSEPPPVVGIVDGEFFQKLAVSTKEILPLLQAGAAVFGASSMGALRAAEAERCGMRGIGRIFELYRRHRIDGDDEVALTFCPETYRPLSEPLVNLRLSLAEARSAGLISGRDSGRLIRRMKRIYFPDRTRQRFWREARLLLDTNSFVRLSRFFEERAPDAKAEDARQMLSAIASFLGKASEEASSGKLSTSRGSISR